MGLMSTVSPAVQSSKVQGGDVAMQQAGACFNPNFWCEAKDFALVVSTFAGGPAVVGHLAATCKDFYQAISEAWQDLTRRFPCRLYVIGGLNSQFREVDTAWRLDPTSGVWEVLPQIVQPVAGAATAVADGMLYVLGGEVSGEALTIAQRFDPSVGGWELLPPMLAGRIRPAAVFSGGYLYVMGGFDGSRTRQSAERFNPSTKTWEELPQMHRPRFAAACAPQPRGCVLAFGGELTETGPATSIERFDPETNTWELLPAVRTLSTGAAVALTGSGRTAFSFGGLSLSGQAQPMAETLFLGPAIAEADARSQGVGEKDDLGKHFQPPAWGPMPQMLLPRQQASAAGFLSGAVVVGGKGPTFEAVPNVEVYNPEAMSWEALPPLPSPRMRAAVASGRL